MVCHFFNHGTYFVNDEIQAMEIRQFLRWTSSVMSLNFLNATLSSYRPTRVTSKTQPLRLSDMILVPWGLMTNVFPIFLTLNAAGAFTSYQSFLKNGSTAFIWGSLFTTFHEALVLVDCHGAAQRAKRLILFWQYLLNDNCTWIAGTKNLSGD